MDLKKVKLLMCKLVLLNNPLIKMLKRLKIYEIN